MCLATVKRGGRDVVCTEPWGAHPLHRAVVGDRVIEWEPEPSRDRVPAPTERKFDG